MEVISFGFASFTKPNSGRSDYGQIETGAPSNSEQYALYYLQSHFVFLIRTKRAQLKQKKSDFLSTSDVAHLFKTGTEFHYL